MGSYEPAGTTRLHQEVDWPVAPDRLEPREFQHVRKACGRVVELVRSKRAHQRRNRDGRENQQYGHGNRQFDHAEATNAAAASAGMWGTLTQNRSSFSGRPSGPTYRDG